MVSQYPKRQTAGTSVQWKSTDVCLDFSCECGWGAHFDGYCAYYLQCYQCGRTYEMPSDIVWKDGPTPLPPGVQAEKPAHEPHEIRSGPDVVQIKEEED